MIKMNFGLSKIPLAYLFFSVPASVMQFTRACTTTAPAKHITTQIKDEVLLVKLNSPGSKVNSLGAELMAEFEATLKEIETNPAVKAAVLISGKPGCFIAGADIRMLEKCKSVDEARKVAHDGQLIFNRMEKCSKPIVAAINGVCLGGGFEVALACHYRIATKDKKTGLGLPEGNFFFKVIAKLIYFF